MSCEMRHTHPMSALEMRSTIEGATPDCVIADGCRHFVEITNKSSNWYRISVEGTCSPPLRFLSDGGWTEQWSSPDKPIGPVLRLPGGNRRSYAAGIDYSDHELTVAQEHEVDAKVTLTGVRDYSSGWKPADTPLVTDELMLLCRRQT